MTSSSDIRRYQFVSQRRSSWARNQNTVAYSSTIKLGPVAHTVLVALMITVLGLIYLTQATKATGYDYQVSSVNTKIDQLSAQQQDLEVQNARLSSLDSTKNSSVASTMTTPSAQYVNN